MEILEYSRAAWRSAKIYLDYLKSSDKGRDVITVQSIERLDNFKFKLYISKKTPYIDSLEIIVCNNGINIKLKERDAKIVVYEERAKYIVIATSAYGCSVLSNSRPEDITLESDLTFLVKNVMNWYAKRHDFIRLPNFSTCKIADIDIPVGASDEQYNGIRTILESAVSYVWGAPGTGKTQMVLSNAIFYYINNEKRVLVLAPTNNALEQSLRGVMNVFDEKKINRSNVIRLGKATTEFMVDYPEICEAGHYDNLATILKKELEELEEHLQAQNIFLLLTDAAQDFHKIESNYEASLLRYKDVEKNLQSCKEELNSLESDISSVNQLTLDISQNIEILHQQLVNQNRYLLLVEQYEVYHKIVDSYYSKVNDLTNELREWSIKQNSILDVISNLKWELQSKEAILKARQKSYNSIFSKIKYCFVRRLKEEAERDIDEAMHNVSVIADELSQNNNTLEYINNKITNVNDSLTLEHRIKWGTPKLFEISNILFSKPMPLQELSDSFDKEFEKFEGFKIDSQLSEKLNNAQCALYSEQTNLQVLRDRKNDLNLHINEYIQEETSLSDRILLYESQFNQIADAVYHKEMVYDKLKNSLENDIENLKDFVVVEDIQLLLEEKREQYQNAIFHLKDIACNKNVVACTIDYAIMHFDELLDGIAVDVAHVFMDEAAYCPLIKSAVCFSFNAPVTLLGDHMQLPPICEMSRKAICTTDHNKLIFLWDLSAVYFADVFCEDIGLEDLYFEYVGNSSPVFLKEHTVFLTKTYRFGEEIASILEKYVYKQGFNGNEHKKTSVTVINVPRTVKKANVRQSIDEAQAIDKYIKTHKLDDFVVLTPYRNQRYLIEKHTKLPQDSVLTIHASQGREWDTVIISVVDVWDKFFMSSRNIRIVNTAVSRARKNLVLVLDYDHWKGCNGELISELSNSYTELIQDELL